MSLEGMPEATLPELLGLYIWKLRPREEHWFAEDNNLAVSPLPNEFRHRLL